MKLGLTVKYHNGDVSNVEAVFADFVAFERTWQRSVAKFEQEVRLTDLAWLAWNVETRRGATKQKFDPDWLILVETVEIAETETDNPLGTTPQLG